VPIGIDKEDPHGPYYARLVVPYRQHFESLLNAQILLKFLPC
jgi:hypothetical protein